MSTFASTTGAMNSGSGQQPSSRLVLLGRAGVLLLPVFLLVLASFREGDKAQQILRLGAAFQIMLSSLIYRNRQRWSQPLGSAIFMLYVIALSWLWMGLGLLGGDKSYLALAQAVLLVVAMALFAVQMMFDSSAREIHQACVLANRLSSRKDWPEDLESCRHLPEVKALREALHTDPTPAFTLLRHEKPQVRIAALAALEFRRNWRSEQLELVLETAQKAVEPAVRSAAISALANVEDQEIIERLSVFLNDDSQEVRRTAAEALLWDTEQHWPWIRNAVRKTLSDAKYQEDGPLMHHGRLLSAEAVSDLNSWVSEKGNLAVRACLTLAVHYGRALNESPDDKLIDELRLQLLDSHAPAVLRIGLAQLLQNNQLLDRTMQERLLDPMNPAPLRLISAEALLSSGTHAGAVAALRDVARMPNREISLATADVVQRRLGVDLGLAVGQPLPNLNSRQAAEVTRRVMSWSMHSTDDANGSSRKG